MKNLFKKISYLGVNKSETTTIEEDINIFVNQTIFWIAVLTFSYCFVYTFFELYALLFIALSYIFLWNLLFVLNIKRKFNLSKLFILIIGNGQQKFLINYLIFIQYMIGELKIYGYSMVNLIIYHIIMFMIK
jgi:hypothetical protein